MDEATNDTQECRVYDQDTWYSMLEYTLFLKHRKPYVYVRERAAGKRVLDFGCGSGYGTAILSESAEHVTGADASAPALEFCQSHYNAPNLTYIKIQPDYTLPFDDNQFDFITSCQVIEHIPDVKQYLELLKRVLKPGGKLILTTPNRKFRLLPFQMIWQPAHEREYSTKTLDKDLSQVFSSYEILGVYGSTSEYDQIYRDHYRQTPLKAYLVQPIKQLMGAILPGGVYRRVRDGLGLSHKPSTTPLPQKELERFSIDDVIIGEDIGRALDFCAICTKE